MQDINDRLYDFALKIILFVRKLPRDIAAYEISRQLVKAGTSIAANYEEARGAFSKEDFTYKISIAFKEARETNLWLRLIRDSKITNEDRVNNLINESGEIRNILGSSLKTARNKTKSKKC